eukprot:2767724-Rhodomonas_salina.8
MPGTDLLHGAMRLRTCYAMPGTDLAYGPMAANALNHFEIHSQAIRWKLPGQLTYAPACLRRDVKCCDPPDTCS